MDFKLLFEVLSHPLKVLIMSCENCALLNLLAELLVQKCAAGFFCKLLLA
jgi:hypothetical protein